MKTEDSQKKDDRPNGGAGRDCPPSPGSAGPLIPVRELQRGLPDFFQIEIDTLGFAGLSYEERYILLPRSLGGGPRFPQQWEATKSELERRGYVVRGWYDPCRMLWCARCEKRQPND